MSLDSVNSKWQVVKHPMRVNSYCVRASNYYGQAMFAMSKGSASNTPDWFDRNEATKLAKYLNKNWK